VLLIALATECYTIVAEARGISLEEGDAGGQYVRRTMLVLGGRGTRLALLVASLLAGLVIALLTVHVVGNWQPSGFPGPGPGGPGPGPGKQIIGP